MKLNKICSCCKKQLDTKKLINNGRLDESGLWVTCTQDYSPMRSTCGSTALLPSYQLKTLLLIKELEKELESFENFRKQHTRKVG
jgi:hypothetical protein